MRIHVFQQIASCNFPSISCKTLLRKEKVNDFIVAGIRVAHAPWEIVSKSFLQACMSPSDANNINMSCVMFSCVEPSMSVEQVLSEHHILNSANCTKIHFPKYKLNIILLHNMPTEHILNWTIVIETFTYWTLSHLKIWSIEHHAIEKHTIWTKPQLNIAQFQLNKNLLEHWQIYQIFTDQLSTEHWTSANWTNQN